ncbi:MAG: hypothetical protein DHS20C15_16720 [Planctomycetota bacterium]|nr:MAG: hypothetical protein DHS20C15_16720 [Planctomycetota bacterium]
MKTSTFVPYTPSEKRRVLEQARAQGEIAWDSLDPMLLDACSSPAKMSALLRSLSEVIITAAKNPDDVMNEDINLALPAEVLNDSDFYRQYSEQVRSLRRMTREEEHQLARRLELARARLEKVVAATRLPADKRTELIERGVNCDALREAMEQEAPDGLEALLAELPCESRDPVVLNMMSEYNRVRQHYVERNLFIVIGMSAAYRTYGLPAMDLIQEGNASLIRAVEKFDWRKDVRFQTYAAFWVRQAIERLITANRGIVRVPNYVQQKLRRLRREGKLPRNHKDVDVGELSELFETNRASAARLIETDRNPYSLDIPLKGDEGEISFAALLAADAPDEEITDSEKHALGRRLDDVMAEHLSKQEREIISRRFGLGGTSPETLEAIGTSMKVSRERVRQMQVKALHKLHNESLMDQLVDFL